MESNNQVKSKLKVKKQHQNAKLPQKFSVNSGFDIYALEDCVVPAHGNLLVRTGLTFQLETGFYTTLTSKLGLAWKKFITVEAGSHDEDSNQEVCVLLFNHSEEEFKLNAGEPVATVFVQQVTDTEILEICDNTKQDVCVESAQQGNQENKRKDESSVEDGETSQNKLLAKEFLQNVCDNNNVDENTKVEKVVAENVNDQKQNQNDMMMHLEQ